MSVIEKRFIDDKIDKLNKIERKSFIYINEKENNVKWSRSNSKVVLNNSFLIHHNKQKIKYYEFRSTEFKSSDIKKLDIEIGDEEKYSSIKGVHCGSNHKEIIIVIDSTLETDLVIEWDMVNNTESNSYDVGKNY